MLGNQSKITISLFLYVLDKTLYCLQILTKIILTEFHDTDIGTQSKHVLLKIFVYLSSCKKNFITSKLEMRCSVNLIFVLIYNGSYRNNTCIFFFFSSWTVVWVDVLVQMFYNLWKWSANEVTVLYEPAPHERRWGL